MKANVQVIRKHRKYTEEFKRQLVFSFEKGIYSVPQLSKLNGIPAQTIYTWIYKYSTFNDPEKRVVEMAKSSSEKIAELERKIKELEWAVGNKQIMIDYLETMMEVAKDELNIDIKKNFGTPQSPKSKGKK